MKYIKSCKRYKITATIFLLFFLIGCSGQTPPRDIEEKDAAIGQMEESGVVSKANEPPIDEDTLTVLKEVSERTFDGPIGQYMVRYNFKALDEPLTEATTYYKSQDRVRVDMVAEGQVTQSYINGNTNTMCTKEEGSEVFTCLTVQEEIRNPISDVEVVASDTDSVEEVRSYRAYHDGTMSIADHVADCYVFEYDRASERTCLSKENVLLYHKLTDESYTSEFIATDYSTTFSDSVFELPQGSEVVDLNKELSDLQKEIGEGDGGSVEEMEALGDCYNECDAQYGSDREAREGCYATCLG